MTKQAATVETTVSVGGVPHGATLDGAQLSNHLQHVTIGLKVCDPVPWKYQKCIDTTPGGINPKMLDEIRRHVG